MLRDPIEDESVDESCNMVHVNHLCSTRKRHSNKGSDTGVTCGRAERGTTWVGTWVKGRGINAPKQPSSRGIGDEPRFSRAAKVECQEKKPSHKIQNRDRVDQETKKPRSIQVDVCHLRKNVFFYTSQPSACFVVVGSIDENAQHFLSTCITCGHQI
jgi:hypothetical protein